MDQVNMNGTETGSSGSKEFVLAYPFKLGSGETLEKLTLRRPKVRDLKAAQKRENNVVDMEIVLISLVCQPALMPEDLDEMDHKDYAVIQSFLR